MMSAESEEKHYALQHNKIKEAFANACAKGKFTVETVNHWNQDKQGNSIIELRNFVVQFTAIDGYHSIKRFDVESEAHRFADKINSLKDPEKVRTTRT